MPSTEYKTADYLQTPADIAAYLDATLEDGDPRLLLAALKDVAEASGGMSQFAKRSGLNRESLYRTLSENGNPKLETLTTLLHSLGLRLSVTPEQQNTN